MQLLIWSLAVLAVTVWSLMAWAAHRLLAMDPSWVGEVGRTAADGPLGAWFERWWPGASEMLARSAELMQSMLAGLGALAPWLVGAVWALGALVLLGGAGVLSLALRWWRGRGPARPGALPA